MNTKSVLSQALVRIPKISKDSWKKLNLLARWMVATRAVVLLMTLMSAIVAGLLAFRDFQTFNWLRWGVMAFGLVMAHATNNMLNDYTDWKKGVDENNYFRTQYGSQPIQEGLMSVKQLFGYIGVTGLLALLSGVYLILTGEILLLWIMLAGAFFLLFYTYPLKYFGLGEIAVLIVWGPLMIGGGYLATTGVWSYSAVLCGLPYAISTTLVLFGKHIDKHDPDKKKKIYTLPVIIGKKAARYTGIALAIIQYILIIYLVLSGLFSPVILISLVGISFLPLLIRFFSKEKPATRPDWYPEFGWPMWYVASAFIYNRNFGFVFILALIAEVVFVKMGLVSVSAWKII